MSLSTATDIAIIITVPNPSSPSSSPLISSERRISPSWTISQLRGRLEPITGIPASSQVIRFNDLSGNIITLNNDNAQLASYPLRKGMELEVHDTRPPSLRQNFTDTTSVPKYTMPESQYSQLTDSVLSWKRTQKLGRFDPAAKSLSQLIDERRGKDAKLIRERAVGVGERCRVNGDDGRRGVVRWVGEIEGLGGEREMGCSWVGVELDEPVGRNDGGVEVEVEERRSDDDQVVGKGSKDRQEGSGEGLIGKEKTRKEMRMVFECKDKFGVFVRPEKVEVGSEWTVLDDLEIGSDEMEEI